MTLYDNTPVTGIHRVPMRNLNFLNLGATARIGLALCALALLWLVTLWALT